MVFSLVIIFIGALIRYFAYFQGFENFNTWNGWSSIIRGFGFFIISYELIRGGVTISGLNQNIRIGMILVAALVIGLAFGWAL